MEFKIFRDEGKAKPITGKSPWPIAQLRAHFQVVMPSVKVVKEVGSDTLRLIELQGKLELNTSEYKGLDLGDLTLTPVVQDSFYI